MEIYIIVDQALPSDVREVYNNLNQNVTVYSTIGALSLQTIPSRINFVLMCGSVFIWPFISFYFRSQILQIVNDHMEQSSIAKKSQNRSFITGLTIQALLPLCSYFPVFALYVYCIFTHQEILFQQFFMYIFSSLPALLDPMITLYFVVPYRRTLMRWCSVMNSPPVVPTTVSVVL
ncbi:unnamed protein product [Caenorhabditis sp. 36 PRJEB53466]|nr:unnamed protein product [Caenorhabditis sp. 36 PRJEB53466]